MAFWLSCEINLNVGYSHQRYYFSRIYGYGRKERIYKQPSYMRSPSHFAPLLEILCYPDCYSNVYVESLL